VEGFDFVGEVWPNGPRAPDPDPIDAEGHGTHVADIEAGKSTDGLHAGVAPDATLLAIKACSSVSTACSGIALLLALDFSLDPNGDGDIADAADVINMVALDHCADLPGFRVASDVPDTRGGRIHEGRPR
jgi:subtilisin family serine protease